jgi:hypothetical protein
VRVGGASLAAWLYPPEAQVLYEPVGFAIRTDPKAAPDRLLVLFVRKGRLMPDSGTLCHDQETARAQFVPSAGESTARPALFKPCPQANIRQATRAMVTTQ